MNRIFSKSWNDLVKRYTCVPEQVSGTHVFLSLGSNLGEREIFLQRAIHELFSHDFYPVKISSLYETLPVSCEENAGKFLNIALEGIWKKDAFSLLELCLKTEQKLGRPADHAHWVSRVVDIDIILFGEEKICTKELTVPHKLAAERLFVMACLAEIAPDRVFPGKGATFQEICERIKKGSC